MATPNYSYEKRQRELAKKRKKEEKAARKSQGGRADDQPGNDGAEAPARAEPTNAETAVKPPSEA